MWSSFHITDIDNEKAWNHPSLISHMDTWMMMSLTSTIQTLTKTENSVDQYTSVTIWLLSIKLNQYCTYSNI